MYISTALVPGIAAISCVHRTSEYFVDGLKSNFRHIGLLASPVPVKVTTNVLPRTSIMAKVDQAEETAFLEALLYAPLQMDLSRFAAPFMHFPLHR